MAGSRHEKALAQEILYALIFVTNDQKDKGKNEFLSQALNLYNKEPNSDNLILFARVANTHKNIKEQQKNNSRNTKSFNLLLKKIPQSELATIKSQKGFEDWVKAEQEFQNKAAAEKAAAEKAAAEKAAAEKAAINIQKLYRGHRGRIVAKEKKIELELENWMINNIPNENLRILLRDHANFLEIKNPSEISQEFDNFVKDKFDNFVKDKKENFENEHEFLKEIKEKIDDVEQSSTFAKSLVRELSGTTYELYSNLADMKSDKFLEKIYGELKPESVEKLAKAKIMEAMESAIAAMKGSFYDENREKKQIILSKIQDNFFAASEPLAQYELFQLFQKVAGAHRSPGFSIFKGPTSSLLAFQKKLKELNVNEMGYSETKERSDGLKN